MSEERQRKRVESARVNDAVIAAAERRQALSEPKESLKRPLREPEESLKTVLREP